MGHGNRLTGLDPSRLRRWLLLFFLALLIPSGVLIRQSYSQLKWEAFHQYRLQAEALSARIDDRLRRLVNSEENRRFSDYAFLVVSGDPGAGFLQRSALSNYPVDTSVPGVIGYFQVDDTGRFSTPLLPAQPEQAIRYGIAGDEVNRRLALHERVQQILGENRLVRSNGSGRDRTPAGKEAERTPGEPSLGAPAVGLFDSASGSAMEAERADQPQAAFDRLTENFSKRKQVQSPAAAAQLGRVEDLKLDRRFEARLAEEQVAAAEEQQRGAQRSVRKERGMLPVPAPVMDEDAAARPPASQTGVRIHTFESELDPFEFSLLDSGHLVLFRKVWRDGRRLVQGLLIERQPFLQATVADLFRESALSGMSELTLAYRGDLFSTFRGKNAQGYYSRAEELSGALLYRNRLAAPLSEMELIYSIRQLPAGPGGRLVLWVAATLLLVLCGGFYLLYRLGLRQIELTRQQQDFVSAISHELKTPLTSIRMYGEMLHEGWASEEKKLSYYDYIHDESERLTRLINNVLQLARMTRNGLVLECRPARVAELLDGIHSKIASVVERADFELRLQADEAAAAVVKIDSDSFSQIMINLVDNALKFSRGAATRRIDITAALERDNRLVFTVRDYGPGVPRDQMKKIFRLFYRSENELTRETIGTGIGLALVSQLATAMGGRVEVINQRPGAAFRVIFPVCASP
ncbi:sensor histidine kinase [Sedimenticola hydrogenitrophicus]|uniref:sensor histidine kinase n=1 Tax=Sedimenticola hydrogenitrophicus TaxID=2967975 RepID=UPI0021A47FEC|nr:HAMP domain-containing sensor histidine kinase [Sedimenticola hydrogenitrophicus]